MNDTRAKEIAAQALHHWGIMNGRPRLIKNRENAVFEVTGPDGMRAALRLHRPGYQTNDAIRSEMLWARSLTRAGLQVPCPIPTLTGDVIADVGERISSMVTWCVGQPLGEGGVAMPWTKVQQRALYSALGEELARLHKASDSLALPTGFSRPRLGRKELLGDMPLWGRFWENPALTPPEQDLLQRARMALWNMLDPASEAGQDFGLIHADALRENILVHDGQVRLIDFDDGVFGFRLYELGVAMSQNWQENNAADLAEALIRGYARIRRLPPGTRKLLPAFITMRVLASCGWALGRYPPDSPEMQNYARRAVTAARFYMEQGQLYQDLT